jgi:hypothetical protein
MIKYIKKVEITLFHSFFPEESEAEKQEMLRLIDEIQKTEIEKKKIVADFASKLKSIESAFKLTAENLRRNGEDREIMTELYFDFLNEKRIYKNAKGEIVRIMPFQESDYETSVPIGINKLVELEDDFETVQSYEDLPNEIEVSDKGIENIKVIDGKIYKKKEKGKDLETA